MSRLACRTLLSLLLIAAAAEAASLKGKLKLSNRGASPAQYRVLALSKNGTAKLATVNAKGAFSVAVRKGVTLHLIDSSNRYFGPIVAAKGSKAHAVASGKSGSLGTVSVKAGFAAAPVGKSSNVFVKQSVSFNKRTGPKGAGKLGLVRKVSARGAAVAAAADDIGADPDGDGIPSAIDVDDDGDLNLDVSDPSQGPSADFEASVRSTLRVPFSNSLNANAAGVSDEQIDAALRDGLILGMHFSAKSAAVQSVNVDCGTLPYCAPGAGAARIRSDNLAQLEGEAWTSYDPDGDGLPNLAFQDGRAYVGVRPSVFRSALQPGDTLYFKAAVSSGPVVVPAVLPFYFLTGPAVKEYSSGGVSRTISYPVAPDSPGTSAFNPLPLGAGSLTLTLWRPQRPAIAGAETGAFVDMGKLSYDVMVAIPSIGEEGGGAVLTCLASEYSVQEGGSLAVVPAGPSSARVQDSSSDAPADAANTLAYTVDLGACLARNGYSTPSRVVMLNVSATTEKGDQTSQDIYFQLPE